MPEQKDDWFGVSEEVEIQSDQCEKVYSPVEMISAYSWYIFGFKDI